MKTKFFTGKNGIYYYPPKNTIVLLSNRQVLEVVNIKKLIPYKITIYDIEDDNFRTKKAQIEYDARCGLVYIGEL